MFLFMARSTAKLVRKQRITTNSMNQIRSIQRSLARNKVFSAINIAGLAIGIAVFLLIAEFVASEWGANRFHQNFTRLYRAAITSKEGTDYYLPPGISPILKQKFPSIDATVRIADGIGGGVLTNQRHQIGLFHQPCKVSG